MKQFNIFYFILYLAWASVTTLVAVYLDEVVGLSLSSIGIIMSILPLIALFVQPLWGGVSDYTGKRKNVLQFSLFFSAIIAILITLFTKSIIVIILYFTYQFFLCAQGPLMDAMAIEYVNRDAGNSFGFIRVWGSVGYAVGAFITGKVANQMGLSWIFYLAALGFAFSFFILFRVQDRPIQTKENHFKSDLKKLLKQKNYIFVLVYGFLLIGSFFGADQYLGLYIRSNGIDVSMIGILTFISVCAEIPFVFNSKKLINHFGVYRLLIFMNVIAILRMFILGSSDTIFLFVLAGIFRGIIVGIFIPLFVEVICDITPVSVVTSAVAIYSAISSGIANFVFTLAGGVIADYIGYEMLYFAYGLLMFIPLGLLFTKMATELKSKS